MKKQDFQPLNNGAVCPNKKKGKEKGKVRQGKARVKPKTKN
jgi:hypothetical protein